MLAETLNALVAQEGPVSEILVVDQGVGCDSDTLARRSDPPITLIRDSGVGLSRARNLAVRRAKTSWVAFIDDDCLPAPGWVQSLARACAECPHVQFVSGRVTAGELRQADIRAVGAQEVVRARLWSGRRTAPLRIGQGLCFAVRREVVQRLGGWDERLGAGTQPFPAGEDLDFNYRFLRAGGIAYQTPQPRVTHLQWRSEDELPELHDGYLRGNAGAAIKQLRIGDLAGGTLLWLRLAWGVGLMVAGAVRSRSVLHWRLALAQAHGFASGTLAGLRQRW